VTDQPPTDYPGDVVVVGQRRSEPWQPFPERPTLVRPDPDVAVLPDEDTGPLDPCFNPETARDWNADAAAAQTTKDLDQYADTEPPTGGRGFNEREYGAALWERADGSVLRGPMRHSDQTFAEAAAAAASGGIGRPHVDIDWTPPEAGLVPIASVHSHGVGGTTPSGHRGSSQGDVAHLLWISDQRNNMLGAGSGAQARIYIASKTFGQYETPGSTKINVYDESNLDAAIGGEEGDEVNPNAQPCGVAS